MTLYEAFLDELEKLATKAFFVGGKRMQTGPGGALKPFMRKEPPQVPKTSEQRLQKQVAQIRARGADPGIARPSKMKPAQLQQSLKKARTQAQGLGAPMY